VVGTVVDDQMQVKISRCVAVDLAYKPRADANHFTDSALKDPLIYYFAMLGKRFGMRQARIWLTFALVKPPDLTGGVCASPCNLIVRG